jgi:hypothetical protein
MARGAVVKGGETGRHGVGGVPFNTSNSVSEFLLFEPMLKSISF